jgi:hypothetical protein
MARKKLLIIFGVIFLLAGILVFVIITHKRMDMNTESIITPSMVIPHLKDGDIVLRQGDGPLSPMFSDISPTDKRFSHLGIARLRGGDISVINSVGFLTNRKRGVEEVSLDVFLQAAKSIGIFRVKSVDGSFISDKAREFIGRPFDWSFDLSEEEYIYCTELLYAILRHTEFEDILAALHLETLNKDIIPLEAITRSSGIDEILNITLEDVKK